MAATLDYDLKKCMPLITQDSRWNVLTVLMLHANIRNRAFVGMDTIAKMATNGNLTKATRAKAWLEQHFAFTLVAYDKRVDEERDLPKRQHLYQLTGTLKACSDETCECHKYLETSRNYLHYAKPEPVSSEVLNGQNIKAGDVLDGQNFNRAKVLNGNVFNGQNVSIYKDKEKEEKEERPTPPETTSMPFAVAQAIDDAARKAYDPVMNHTGAMMTAEVYMRVFEGACKARSAPQRISRSPANKVIAAQWYLDGYKDDEIRRAVDMLFEEGKPVKYAFLGEKMANNRQKKPVVSPLAKLKIITADDGSAA